MSADDDMRMIDGWQTVYWEHSDIITCLAAHPHDSELFFSGSKDSTVKLWDK